MKGCLCSDKKGHTEIWLDKWKFLGKNGRSEMKDQLLRSKCAVLNFP